MAKLYLIRHGKPENVHADKRCIGITDIALSEEGRGQIRELRDKLKTANIKKIYVSPLSRSEESGRILAGNEAAEDISHDARGGFYQEKIPVIVKDNLREIAMGSWENRTFAEIRENDTEAYAARGASFADFVPEGGESFRECQNRAWEAYREILAEQKTDENIAIVGHVGFFRALISFLEGRDLNRLMEIQMNYADVYIWDIGPVLGAVIASAGLSSRMNAFKPLLPIRGQSFLKRELTTLFRAGIRHVVVVTGREREQVETEVEGPGVTCIHNKDYLTTKMFDSALLGIRSLPEWLEGTFFLPVDAPVFSLFTIRREQEAWVTDGAKIFQPWCGGAAGHPLLIRREAFGDIFRFDGNGGLRRFCSEHQNKSGYLRTLDLPDPGAVLDADSPEEYEKLCAYEEKLGIPDRERCMDILGWAKAPAHLRAHSLAVAGKAAALAEAYNQNVEKRSREAELSEGNDFPVPALLNLPLVEAAALLHDIAKGYKFHGRVGADWLRQLGHDVTADVIEHHEHLPKHMRGKITETSILYLADKLIIGDEECTLDERYQKKMEAYSGDRNAEAAIGEKWNAAKEMMELYKNNFKA